MRKRNCQNCLFGDQCPSAQVCEHYAPLDDYETVDGYIESERQEFHRDWLSYTAEDGD